MRIALLEQRAVQRRGDRSVNINIKKRLDELVKRRILAPRIQELYDLPEECLAQLVFKLLAAIIYLEDSDIKELREAYNTGGNKLFESVLRKIARRYQSATVSISSQYLLWSVYDFVRSLDQYIKTGKSDLSGLHKKVSYGVTILVRQLKNLEDFGFVSFESGENRTILDTLRALENELRLEL